MLVPLTPEQRTHVAMLLQRANEAQATLQATVTVLALGHVPPAARLLEVSDAGLVFHVEPTDAD